MYGDELLSRNEAALRSLDITVINLAPAEAGIDRHEYVYWRNDTRWNLRGVKIAQRRSRAFPALSAACRKG
jgi:hypothetical protein